MKTEREIETRLSQKREQLTRYTLQSKSAHKRVRLAAGIQMLEWVLDGDGSERFDPADPTGRGDSR